jgi:hypothetical protein
MKRENIKIQTSKVRISKNIDTRKNFSGRKIVNKKTRHISLFRLSMLIIIITLIILGLYFVAKSSIVAIGNMGDVAIGKVKYMKEERDIKGLQKVETINIENKSFGQKEVLENLSKIMILPDEDISMFAKVNDPEQIIRQSEMYKGIKKGDYIIVYPSLALVFDSQSNKVVKTLGVK